MVALRLRGTSLHTETPSTARIGPRLACAVAVAAGALALSLAGALGAWAWVVVAASAIVIGVASRPTTLMRRPVVVMAASRKSGLANRSATRSPALQFTSDEIGWYCCSGWPGGAIRSPSAARTGCKGSTDPFGAIVPG